MPVLPICQGSDDISGDEFALVYAVMLFPEDTSMREPVCRWSARPSAVRMAEAITKIASATSARVSMPAEMLELLAMEPADGLE